MPVLQRMEGCVCLCRGERVVEKDGWRWQNERYPMELRFRGRTDLNSQLTLVCDKPVLQSMNILPLNLKEA